MGVISNKPVTVAPAILTEAGETLSNGDLVSMVDNKLYELPQSLDTMTTVLNFTRHSSNSYVSSNVMQGGAKILTVYANSSGYPEARLYITTDDGIQQVGTTFVINSAVAYFLNVFKLSEEYVLIYYTTGSNTSAIPYLCLLKITGNVISSVGTTPTCLSTGVVGSVFELLSYDGVTWKVLLVGNGYDSSIPSYAQILSVTTSGITKGSLHSWGAYTSSLQIAVLSENNFVLASTYGNTLYLRAYTVSDTTLTQGSITSISVTSIGTRNLKSIDSNRCYYYYQNNTNSYKHRIVTVSGTAITLGTEYAIDSGITPIDAGIVDIDKVLFVYGQSSVYYAKILTIDGTVIDTTATAITVPSAVIKYVKRYGNKYLYSSTGTYLVSISGTNIIATLVANFGIGSYQSYTPYKYFSFTIDSTTAANSKAILYVFTGLFEPTGYVISDSRFVSNTVQKAAYMPF